jgi:GNAT superfamily N-acetyltransferase
MTELGQRAAARLAGLDPLLPASVELPPAAGPATEADPAASCDAIFTASSPAGELTAVGWCEHRFHEPESASLTWGSARQFGLRPVIVGPEIAAPLDDLLRQWCDHLAGIAQADDEDSSALIRWPSRGIEGVSALQRHGLTPKTVTAARISSSGDRDVASAAPAGVSVRRAGAADTDLVAEFSLDLVRYEAHFGNLRIRPWTEAAMHKEAAELLAEPEPWAWLAERDGTPVGMLSALRPASASWIAPQVRLAPVAYLGEMFVRPAERGSGVAGLLTSQFSDAAAAAGVAVTLLHYGQVNPLSGPFWSRQGYRPLWTTWEAVPARTLR